MHFIHKRHALQSKRVTMNLPRPKGLSHGECTALDRCDGNLWTCDTCPKGPRTMLMGTLWLIWCNVMEPDAMSWRTVEMWKEQKGLGSSLEQIENGLSMHAANRKKRGKGRGWAFIPAPAFSPSYTRTAQKAPAPEECLFPFPREKRKLP